MYILTPCLINFTTNYLMNYDFRIDEEREYGTVEFHKKKSNISRLYHYHSTWRQSSYKQMFFSAWAAQIY